MNLGTLNTIIALVVVLLVLSLVVQSIQTALKKALKLKSKQIEDSLKDLFDQAIATAQPPTTPTTRASSKLKSFWEMLMGVERHWSAEAEQFKTGILQQFKNVGRVTRFGNPVLDSLSKEDLMKVMAKLDLQRFFPEYITRLEALCDQIKDLRTAVESLAKNQELAGSASAKISELRATVTPLINDAQALVDDKQKVKPQVVFGDLLRLTKLEVSSVLTLVTQAQTAVNVEIEKAKQASGDIKALEQISTSLSTVAKVIGDLSQKFDHAVAPLRGKLTQVETWFDTVTQSFDERYTRHMRTVSIFISIVVVVILNANFFTMYKRISSNEIQKNLILEAGPKLLDEAKKSEAAAQASATASPTPIDIKKEADRTKQTIEAYVNTYEQFGFAPLSAKQIESFFRSSAIVGWVWDCDDQPTWLGCTIKRDAKGSPVNKQNVAITSDCVESGDEAKGIDCYAVWRPQTPNEWWSGVKANFTGLLGWAVMVVLLSVGAPFWQDTLESLFGIKNLLRQKSATQNVEQRSGAGQPRS